MLPSNNTQFRNSLVPLGFWKIPGRRIAAWGEKRGGAVGTRPANRSIVALADDLRSAGIMPRELSLFTGVPLTVAVNREA